MDIEAFMSEYDNIIERLKEASDATEKRLIEARLNAFCRDFTKDFFENFRKRS